MPFLYGSWEGNSMEFEANSHVWSAILQRLGIPEFKLWCPLEMQIKLSRFSIIQGKTILKLPFQYHPCECHDGSSYFFLKDSKSNKICMAKD